MHQQLVIMCSNDLDNTVTRTLNDILDEGYLHLPNAVGVKPKVHVPVERAISFSASVFLVISTPSQIEAIVSALKVFSNQCLVEPCLKMVVSEVAQIY